jgi:WD40 repeat protein
VHRSLILFATAVGVPLFGFAQPAGRASFARDIAPVLQRKCVTCHGPDKQKGNFRLDSFEALLRAGTSKLAPIAAGKPESSHLVKLINEKDPDERMPQKDDPLPAATLALFARWIREGAEFDGPDRRAPLASIIPKRQHPAPPEVYKLPLPVLALAFSPDGSQLAAGGYNEVMVWNPADGRLLRRIRGLPQRTQALAWSADGAWLAAGGGDPGQGGELAWIDMKKGEVARVLVSLPDVVLDVKFSPDGTQLALGAADNSIRVLEVPSGRERLRIDQHADWVMGVAWSPDGTELASASRDRSARVFDARTGALEHSYLGHNIAVFSVAFSPDGKSVLSAGRDKRVHIWTAKDARKTGEISGFDDDIVRLAVAGGHVWSCGADKIVRQHSADGATLVRAYAGHADWVYSLAVHPASQRLASGSFDGRVRIWDTGSGNLVREFIASPGLHMAERK